MNKGACGTLLRFVGSPRSVAELDSPPVAPSTFPFPPVGHPTVRPVVWHLVGLVSCDRRTVACWPLGIEAGECLGWWLRLDALLRCVARAVRSAPIRRCPRTHKSFFCRESCADCLGSRAGEFPDPSDKGDKKVQKISKRYKRDKLQLTQVTKGTKKVQHDKRDQNCSGLKVYFVPD